MDPFEFIQSQTLFAAAVFIRISAMCSLLPGIGENFISVRVKLLISFAITLVVTPLVVSIELTAQNLSWIILTEVCIGLIFGFGLRLFIISMQSAGSIAANVVSLAQLFNGPSEQQPIVATTLQLAAIALVFVSGMHLNFVEYAISSYNLFPIGKFPAANETSEWAASRANESFLLAFSLAAPFVLLSLLYNVTIGVINRAMPQLMVALVGAPFITGASLVILALSAPTILEIWLTHVQAFLRKPI